MPITPSGLYTGPSKNDVDRNFEEINNNLNGISKQLDVISGALIEIVKLQERMYEQITKEN